MQIRRSWSSLLIVVAAAMLVDLSVVPVEAADPAIRLSYDIGPPTSSFHVSGTGLGASQVIRLYFDGQLEATTATDASGAFSSTTVGVPADARPGKHTVGAVAPALGRHAQRNFIVRTSWPEPGSDVGGRRWNRTENQVGPGNVADITRLWRAHLGEGATQPILSGGVIYVESGPAAGRSKGRLYAFKVGCAPAGGTCTPIWTARLGGERAGVPAVSDGVVYAVDDTRLAAYRVGCATGGATCSPIWKAAVDGPSNPVVRDGVVYIGSGHGLLAFSAGCATGGGTCSPVWRGATHHIVGDPVISADQVFVPAVQSGAGASYLYAFQTGCASHGSICSPTWHFTSGSSSVNTFAAAAVSGGVVYFIAQSGDTTMRLNAIDAHCGTGNSACTPLWSGSIPYEGPSIAVDGSTVYAMTDAITAFAVGCNTGGGTCTPIWRATTDADGVPPLIANGLLYAGGQDVGIRVYDAACNVGGGKCGTILKKVTRTDPSVGVDPPFMMLADGVLYASEGSWLVAYGLP